MTNDLILRMLASVGLGVPAAFYLLQSSPTKVASHNHHGETRMTERKEAEIPPERETVGPDVKPSEVDEVSNSLCGLHSFTMSNVC
jgi:hypothetical protein